ncbi:MAG: hypothetical protein ABFE07_04905 [Armatimonadia bacterium]
MADTQMAGRFDTKCLDRHNDRISVYLTGNGFGGPLFTDGGEAVQDLMCRVPGTTPPEGVLRLVGHVIGELAKHGCRLTDHMHIVSDGKKLSFLDEINRGIDHIVQAYLAVDRIDVEEVLAGDNQSDDH